MSTQTPTCCLCGHVSHWLGTHLTESHGLSVEAYLQQYPGAVIASAKALAMLYKGTNGPTRTHPPDPRHLTTTIVDFRYRVNYDVPEDACLPMPDHYRIPTHGELALDVRDAAISFVRGRSMYLWGPQGTGKDAFPHFCSAVTRTPGLLFQMQPAEDNRAWFFSHEFTKDGTFWAEGRLLKALRYGYTSPTTGRVLPYMILITDVDRATKEQLEGLRLVLDSIEGRVSGPGGVVYHVLPGTQIIMTGNTAGGGDEYGRYVSANVMDSSILDRIDRVYEFHTMLWEDEEPIVKAKFPLLVEKCPTIFKQVGKATMTLREAIRGEKLFAQFSHRAVCAWLGAATDIIAVSNNIPPDLLTRSFRVVRDKLSDQETRNAALMFIDPHVKGGALPKK